MSETRGGFSEDYTAKSYENVEAFEFRTVFGWRYYNRKPNNRTRGGEVLKYNPAGTLPNHSLFWGVTSSCSSLIFLDKSID